MNEKRHTELEVKFDASRVDLARFRSLMMETNPHSFECVQHDDVFWKRGANIVRHRQKGPGAGELTVKQRRSEDSLLDRLEINLRFSPKVEMGDVSAFLVATGYEQLFTLRKRHVDVFEFTRSSFAIEAALYYVGRVDEHGISGERAFLELEIKPGPDMDVALAKSWLDTWSKWLQQHLDVGEPLNLSLFEYYSQLRSPSVNPDVGTHYRI